MNGSRSDIARTPVIAILIGVIVVALAASKALQYRAYVMPSGSMEDTLLIGDYFLVKLMTDSKPIVPRDEIVVVKSPADPKETSIRRILGIPGDRIRISRKKVTRNGVLLQEPYAVHKFEYFDSYRDEFPSEPNMPVTPAAIEMLERNVSNGEVVVPSGRYFLMGDNRDSSYDSRYLGFVPVENVIGKPAMIYFSKSETGVRWSRIFKSF
jgi:signal peptidase I